VSERAGHEAARSGRASSAANRPVRKMARRTSSPAWPTPCRRKRAFLAVRGGPRRRHPRAVVVVPTPLGADGATSVPRGAARSAAWAPQRPVSGWALLARSRSLPQSPQYSPLDVIIHRLYLYVNRSLRYRDRSSALAMVAARRAAWSLRSRTWLVRERRRGTTSPSSWLYSVSIPLAIPPQRALVGPLVGGHGGPAAGHRPDAGVGQDRRRVAARVVRLVGGDGGPGGQPVGQRMDRGAVVRATRRQGEGHRHPTRDAAAVQPPAEEPLLLGRAVAAAAPGAGVAADRHRHTVEQEDVPVGADCPRASSACPGQPRSACRRRRKRDALSGSER
jgi:hypothetical protein